MSEGIKEFLERASEDEGLRARVAECESLGEAFEAIGGKEAGFTLEEFSRAIADVVPEGDELSPDNLSQAAGGMAVEGGYYLHDICIEVYDENSIFNQIKCPAKRLTDWIRDSTRSSNSAN